VVDTETGQVADDCPSCLALEQERRVQRAQMTRLKNELARAMGVEPEAADILEVCEYWRQLVAPRASIVVGQPRYKAVRDRLRDTDARTRERLFNPLKLKAAVVGITLDPWHMAPGQRHRRDLDIAFSNSNKVERLIGQAIGFKRRTGTSALALVDELAGDALFWLAERCGCGHIRLEHVRLGPRHDGTQPCSVAGCGCADMDWFAARVDRWERQQQAAGAEAA
jgi:hypothetical protein